MKQEKIKIYTIKCGLCEKERSDADVFKLGKWYDKHVLIKHPNAHENYE